MAQQEWLNIIFAWENKLFDKHVLTEQSDPVLEQDIKWIYVLFIKFRFAQLINKGLFHDNT